MMEKQFLYYVISFDYYEYVQTCTPYLLGSQLWTSWL